MKWRLLVSYHYFRKALGNLLSALPSEPILFGDSGAYSAFSKGAQITVDDYAGWLSRWQDRFAHYANLDVIGDPARTFENQRILESMGFSPLPVFHVGEDWSYLEHYVERYPYVCLGGMVPYMSKSKRIMPWLIKAFKIAGDRAVFHGFGATTWRVVRDLPWYSLDSSTWAVGVRFGRVTLFDARRQSFVSLPLGRLDKWRRFRRLAESYGLSVNDFGTRTNLYRNRLIAASLDSYLRLVDWLRKRHGEIKIKGVDAPPGPLLYFAAANNTPDNLKLEACLARKVSHEVA